MSWTLGCGDSGVRRQTLHVGSLPIWVMSQHLKCSLGCKSHNCSSWRAVLKGEWVAWAESCDSHQGLVCFGLRQLSLPLHKGDPQHITKNKPIVMSMPDWKKWVCYGQIATLAQLPTLPLPPSRIKRRKHTLCHLCNNRVTLLLGVSHVDLRGGMGAGKGMPWDDNPWLFMTSDGIVWTCCWITASLISLPNAQLSVHLGI